jgi:hypothetical protein
LLCPLNNFHHQKSADCAEHNRAAKEKQRPAHDLVQVAVGGEIDQNIGEKDGEQDHTGLKEKIVLFEYHHLVVLK